MEAYPEAKVLLTTRRADTWYGSVHQSIYQFIVAAREHFAVDLAMKLFFRGSITARNCGFHNVETLNRSKIIVYKL